MKYRRFAASSAQKSAETRQAAELRATVRE